MKKHNMEAFTDKDRCYQTLAIVLSYIIISYTNHFVHIARADQKTFMTSFQHIKV